MSEGYMRHLVGFQGKDSMRDKAKRMFEGSKMNSSELKVKSSASAPSKTKTRLYAKGGAVRSERTITMANHLKKGRCYNDGGEVEGDMEPVTMRRGGKTKSHHKHHGGHHMAEGRHHKERRHEEMEGHGTSSHRKMFEEAMHEHHKKGKHKVGKHHHRRKGYEDGGMVMGDEPQMGAEVMPASPMMSRARQAYGMVQRNAPRAQSFLDRNAPRLGRAFSQARSFANSIAPRAQQAYGMAKRYAPQAQDFISKFSPSLGQKFGRFRSMVGLKKGGKAKHAEHYAMGGVGKIRHGQSTKAGKPIMKKRKKGY